MKFTYIGTRPKLVTIIVSPGDTIDLSTSKSINLAQRHRDFEEVKKSVKVKKATNKGLTT